MARVSGIDDLIRVGMRAALAMGSYHADKLPTSSVSGAMLSQPWTFL